MQSTSKKTPRGLSALLAAAVATPMVLGACGGEPERDKPRSMMDAPAREGVEAAEGAVPRLEIPTSAPTVAFVGDSIGAGLHLPEHQAFPAVLQRRMVALDEPFHLVNASESGRTTAGGLTAIDWVMRSEPDLVVIELGGNDGLRGIALDAVERNLRAMIERTRAGGARVLLLGVRLPPNFADYGEDFDALYPALAAEYELDFIPFFMEGVGAEPDMNLADGLHPNPEGHEHLADNLLPVLREALASLEN